MHVGRYKKGEWSGSYQKILFLAEKGMLQKDIAEKVGLSASQVCRVLRDERFVARRTAMKERLEEEIYEKFSKAAKDAASKIIAIMQRGRPTERIRLDAAKDVLTYAGLQPKQQVEHITNNYTIEDANSAKKVLEEINDLQSRLSVTDSQFLLTGEPPQTKLQEPITSEEKVKEEPKESLKEGLIERTIPSGSD